MLHFEIILIECYVSLLRNFREAEIIPNVCLFEIIVYGIFLICKFHESTVLYLLHMGINKVGNQTKQKLWYNEQKGARSEKRHDECKCRDFAALG